jgi:hypothetical protein
MDAALPNAHLADEDAAAVKAAQPSRMAAAKKTKKRRH